MILHYHLCKANIVADAFSRLSMESLAHVEKQMQELVKDIDCLDNLGDHLLDSMYGWVMLQEVFKSYLSVEIKEKQVLDPILIKIKSNVGVQKVLVFEINGDGTLWYQGRLCVPDVDELR